MRSSITTILSGLLLAGAWLHPIRAAGAGEAIGVVAAESMYGNLATQLGGDHVRVTSILSNPNGDPHLFEVSPAVARSVARADLVIRNGLGYDPWMKGLLAARGGTPPTVIAVADLAGRHDGDNPHLWYDPSVMPQLASAMTAEFTRRDPADGAVFASRLDAVLADLKPVSARVAALRERLSGTPIAATEPVFGPMAEAIGLDTRDRRFALAVMNGTEPAASDVAALESDLREHRVRVLITNSQVSNAAADRLKRIARESAVPMVGVSETEPAGVGYTDWMLAQLDALETALKTAPVPRGSDRP